MDAVSQRRLLAYALPALPLATLSLPIYIYLPAFYAEDLGLGFGVVGAVLLAARLWDVVTDPIIGILSDRSRSRFGRRRPWMIAGTPLLILSMFALFVPGAQSGAVWLLVWSCLFYLAGTMVLLPYNAWGAEISPDYHQRSRISSAREAMIVVGTFIAAGLPALLANDRSLSLFAIALGVFCVLPISVGIAARFVPDTITADAQRLTCFNGLRLLRKNKPFLRLVTAYLLNGIANGLPATLFLLYVEHVLERPQWAGLFLLIYFAIGVAGIPLWMMVSRHLGKHRTWAMSMVLASLVFATVPLLGPENYLWFFAVCTLTGFTLGADLILPPSMQADVLDLDRMRSKSHRAGLFFAIWGIATKLALALAVGIAFPTLELFGFTTKGTAQTETALFTLTALYSLVPVAFKLAAMGLVAGYPITEATQKRIRRIILARSGHD